VISRINANFSFFDFLPIAAADDLNDCCCFRLVGPFKRPLALLKAKVAEVMRGYPQHGEYLFMRIDCVLTPMTIKNFKLNNQTVYPYDDCYISSLSEEFNPIT